MDIHLKVIPGITCLRHQIEMTCPHVNEIVTVQIKHYKPLNTSSNQMDRNQIVNQTTFCWFCLNITTKICQPQPGAPRFIRQVVK